MYSWVTLSHLAEWTDATSLPDPYRSHHVKGISTDSRQLVAGAVFVALKGPNFDGHDYLEKAQQAGACAAIVDHKVDIGMPTLVVKDTLSACVAIAKNLRAEFKGPVFAITGSAGKSSTKEMTARLLGENVVASPASFNNLLGVSKTLFLVEDHTEYLVLEMGMNASGEIKQLCETFCPNAGMITNIGDAHLGRLGSLEAIYRAKKEMFDFLATSDRTSGVVVNFGNASVKKAYEESFSGREVPYVSYDSQGSLEVDVAVEKVALEEQTGFLQVKLSAGSEAIQAALALFGRHHAENLAAAIAAATHLGVPIKDIRDRLTSIRPASHRGEVHAFSDRVLIDESYNSNPSALRASLESLIAVRPEQRKIIILGDMAEMGEFADNVHEELGKFLGELIRSAKADFVLVGVGTHVKKLLEGAQSATEQRLDTISFETAEQCSSWALEFWKPGDVVFVKSSRSGQLERVVAKLCVAEAE